MGKHPDRCCIDDDIAIANFLVICEIEIIACFGSSREFINRRRLKVFHKALYCLGRTAIAKD